jgi:hypothetical protein
MGCKTKLWILSTHYHPLPTLRAFLKAKFSLLNLLVSSTGNPRKTTVHIWVLLIIVADQNFSARMIW